MRLSEVIKVTGHNQLFLQNKMKTQIALEPGFTSLLAVRICIISIESTNLKEGEYAWHPQEHLKQLFGAKSEESIRKATRQAEGLGWLRSEPVYRNGECVGVRYYMPWERWNERSTERHANDNNPNHPQPELGTPPTRVGDLPNHRRGNKTYKYNLEDNLRDSLSADAPRESRDSRAASETEAPTGMDLVDAFLSDYPLTEYIEDQTSRYEPPDETEVWRITTVWLHRVMNRGISFDTILAGARRYRDHLRSNPEKFVRSPQAWLAKGCWDDEFAPGSAALNDNRTLEKRIHSMKRAAI